MRNKTYQIVITGLFLFFILFPLFQQITGVVPEPRLQEKRRLTPVPALVLGSLVSGSFQTQFDRFMNDNYGLRAWMVMINNQIDISVFHVTQ